MGGEKGDFGIPSRPPGKLLRFGIATLGSPILTLIVLEIVYAFSVPVCGGKLSSLSLHLTLALTMAALVGIALYGRRFLKRDAPLDTDEGTSVASFTAVVLLAVTGLCLLIVIAQWIAVFAMPCTY